MLDASRVVDVVSSLLSDERRAGVRARPTASCRRRCGSSTARGRSGRCCRTRRRCANRLAIDWARGDAARAAVRRPPRSSNVPLEDLVPYIDWTFFFAAWELKGRFPAILEHPQYGKAARDLYDSAQVLLDRIVGERLLTATRRLRLLAGRERRRRHRRLSRSRARRRARAVQPAAAAGGDRRRQAEPVARRLHRAALGARRRRAPTTSARSRSRRGSAPTRWRQVRGASSTTTARSS